MEIPILWQHDSERKIGKFEFCEDENCYIVTFFKEFNITDNQFFSIFNCGAQIIEDEWPDNIMETDDDWHDLRIIRKAKIIDLSVNPNWKYNEQTPIQINSKDRH